MCKSYVNICLKSLAANILLERTITLKILLHIITNRANKIKSALGDVKEFSYIASYFAKKMILPVTIKITIFQPGFYT